MVNAYDPTGRYIDQTSLRPFWTWRGAMRWAQRMTREGARRGILVPYEGHTVPLVQYRVERRQA